MKAALMYTPGGPEVLTAGEVETPVIQSDTEVLVRLKGAGVNPIDTKLRSRGTYFPERMPAVLGCDGAGVVAAVGPAVERFAVGDEVYFFHGGIGGAQGNYAQWTVVEEALLAAKPAALGFEQAAAAPLVCITAWESLFDRARVEAGSRVLIHAGAGGVGHVAVQLARHAGADVAVTVGDAAKGRLAEQLGAERIIPYRERDFVDEVMDWCPGGVDMVFDTVGGDTFERSFAALRPYGDLVSLLQPGPEVDWKLARLRNARCSLELMLSPQFYGWEQAMAHQTWILEQCGALLASGKLNIHISHILDLDQAAEAHRLIEHGGMSGKAVLRVD